MTDPLMQPLPRDRLTFLASFDVRHILQEGTPDQVRQEVRAA